MNLSHYHNVYFLGIGGIGMSALARWFNLTNHQVYGYDRTSTPLCNQMKREGINIHYVDDASNISEKINKSNTVVIITPAIPKDNKELKYFKNNNFVIKKRSEIIGKVASRYFSIAIAGTHGKTTTCSILAHLLCFAKKEMVAFVGGILSNYDSNLVTYKSDDEQTVAVVEADEFDQSFLSLFPNISIITSIDADHLDIYENEQKLKLSFIKFMNQTDINETIYINKCVSPDVIHQIKNKNIETYGLENANILAKNIRHNNGHTLFDYHDNTQIIKDIKLTIAGLHNVENAIVATKMAIKLGLSETEIKNGFESFMGIKRRFEYILKSSKITFIDDYAHHPVEISSFLKSLKAIYPDKRITIIFQPHLYSRTQDFKEEFAKSLSLANEVILLDIYPAREKPIPGITSKIIFDDIKTKKTLLSEQLLLKYLETIDIEILATVGAGNISEHINPIKQFLERKLDV